MKIILTIFLFISSAALFSQSYVGKSREQITSLVPKEMPGFAVNTFGKNPDVNSLKFYDSKKDRSLIFFFDNKNICSYYKLIDDISLYNTRVTEFNTSYTTAGKDKWTTKVDGKSIKISIEKSDYIMTVLYTL